jgi:hypothetical protein
MDHAVHGLVDSSVASGYQNQIRATLHGATRDLGCVSRTAGGDRVDSDPALVQQLDGASKRMASPSECAGVRIVNKYWLVEALDSILIILEGPNYRRRS